MSDQVKKQELLDTVAQLSEQIRQLEVSVPVVLSDIDDPEEVLYWVREASEEEVVEQQREDLTWLYNHLRKNNRVLKYKGNYVAVFRREIIGWAESRRLLTEALTFDYDEHFASAVLIAPVLVSGDDANLEWLQLCNRLGLDIHPGSD